MSIPRQTPRGLVVKLAWLSCAIFVPKSNVVKSQATTTSAISVYGQTLNAVTRTPIPRVLVRCGTQAMLTDYQGQFHFDGDCSPASISAFKPGYFLGDDAFGAGPMLPQTALSTQPILIPLYPEAVLTGSVTSAEGAPLTGVLIAATRSQYDESGHHWVPAGTTRTDSHGEFRLPLPAGGYSVQSTYSSPTPIRRQAVLPVSYPENSSSKTLILLRLKSGETQRIDLHPQLQPVTAVSVALEPASRRPNVSITARQTSGSKIPLRPSAAAAEGEVKIEVPSGSYTLEAIRQTPEGMEQAQTAITVGTAELRGVQLRFAPISPLPIEIVQAASTSDNKPPAASQLGLGLENADPADLEEDFLRPTQHGSQFAVFNAPPGTYRLRAQSGGPWYVLSATYGMSDLLRQDLVVSAGVAAATVRIVASDQTASLSGGIRAGDQAAGGYVYLLAATPSATPVIILRADASGKYSRANVPPGSYRVLAFEHRRSINFEDPETLAAFSNSTRAVTLNAGDKTSLDLDLTPWPESLR